MTQGRRGGAKLSGGACAEGKRILTRLPERGAGFTLGYLRAIFEDSNLRSGLATSVLIAILVTLACVLISVPLALLSVRYEFAGKRIVTGLLLVPLILPLEGSSARPEGRDPEPIDQV